MGSEVESLGEALGKVCLLSKSQLQKELAGVVRYSQGTSRASWKRDKAPNWWREGELVDAYNVKAEIEPFGPVKNSSTSGMQAALVMFYSSRIYFENNLKERLSASELEDIADGKNPYPAKHYASNNPAASKSSAPMPSEEVMNTPAKAKTIEDGGSEVEVQEDTDGPVLVCSALPDVAELSDEDVTKEEADENPISGSIEENTEEEESDEEDSKRPEETEQEFVGEQVAASSQAEVERDGGEDSHSAASETETIASASTVPEREPEDSSAYSVPDLCKVINKLKKRCLEDRKTALLDMFVAAVEERANRTIDTAEQKSWLTILSLELSIAISKSQREETKRKDTEQLQRHKTQVNQHIKMQLYRLSPAIRNMPIEEFEELGGTADKARKGIADVNSEEALGDSAKITETVRKTRRTARKVPPTEVLETPAIPQAPSTAMRRSRRNAAQASSAKTRALFEGTPLRAPKMGETLVFSANGSPLEIGPLISKTRTTRATRAGRPPVAPVPFADALSSLLSTQSQEDPEGLKEILLATARKIPTKRSKR